MYGRGLPDARGDGPAALATESTELRDYHYRVSQPPLGRGGRRPGGSVGATHPSSVDKKSNLRGVWTGSSSDPAHTPRTVMKEMEEKMTDSPERSRWQEGQGNRAGEGAVSQPWCQMARRGCGEYPPAARAGAVRWVARAQTTCTESSVAVTGAVTGTPDLGRLSGGLHHVAGAQRHAARDGAPELGRRSRHDLVGRHYRLLPNFYRWGPSTGDRPEPPRQSAERHHPARVGAVDRPRESVSRHQRRSGDQRQQPEWGDSEGVGAV